METGSQSTAESFTVPASASARVPQHEPLVHQLQQHITTKKTFLLPSWQAKKVDKQCKTRGRGGGEKSGGNSKNGGARVLEVLEVWQRE